MPGRAITPNRSASDVWPLEAGWQHGPDGNRRGEPDGGDRPERAAPSGIVSDHRPERRAERDRDRGAADHYRNCPGAMMRFRNRHRRRLRGGRVEPRGKRHDQPRDQQLLVRMRQAGNDVAEGEHQRSAGEHVPAVAVAGDRGQDRRPEGIGEREGEHQIAALRDGDPGICTDGGRRLEMTKPSAPMAKAPSASQKRRMSMAMFLCSKTVEQVDAHD